VVKVGCEERLEEGLVKGGIVADKLLSCRETLLEVVVVILVLKYVPGWEGVLRVS
jgi:hypothetical protein